MIENANLVLRFILARMRIFVLTQCVIFGLIGCLLQFPLETDTEVLSDTDTDTDTDTEFDTGTESNDDTDSETEINSCPSGFEFVSTVQYTEVAESDRLGQEFLDTCPDGQVIVGFEGFLRPRENWWNIEVHGKIRAICGVPSIRRVEDACVVNIGAGDSLPMRGKEGEIEWSRMCPEDQMIIGFKAWFGNSIYQLVFRCASLLIMGNGNGHAITTGWYVDLGSVGADKSEKSLEPNCPAFQIATGTKLKADDLLGAVSLGCQVPSLEY